MSATAKITLDKRRPDKAGLFPVVLRITSHGKPRLYSIKQIEHLSQEQMDKIKGPKPRREHKELRYRFDALEKKAEHILLQLGDDFTFDDFKLMFFSDQARPKPKPSIPTVYALFEEMIETKRRDNNVTTADSYLTALRAFRAYRTKLDWKDLTPAFFKGFEHHCLVEKQRSISTVGVYVRPMKAVINIAIDRGIVRRDDAPFGRHRYVVPKSQNTKKALSKAQVMALINDPTEDLMERRSIDFWTFTYLCNGMNWKDMVLLRYSMIQDGMLTFRRQKVVNSSGEVITLPLSTSAQKIIRRWGQPMVHGHELIFDILSEDIAHDPAEIKKKTRQLGKTVSKYMNRVGARHGITENITQMHARHSFATILSQEGAPTDYLRESLGHTNVKTTQNYLKGVGKENNHHWHDKLLE